MNIFAAVEQLYGALACTSDVKRSECVVLLNPLTRDAILRELDELEIVRTDSGAPTIRGIPVAESYEQPRNTVRLLRPEGQLAIEL